MYHYVLPEWRRQWLLLIAVTMTMIAVIILMNTFIRHTWQIQNNNKTKKNNKIPEKKEKK